jgi:hypothetical protein
MWSLIIHLISISIDQIQLITSIIKLFHTFDALFLAHNITPNRLLVVKITGIVNVCRRFEIVVFILYASFQVSVVLKLFSSIQLNLLFRLLTC